MFTTLEWTGNSLRLLDQTRLPTETVYVEITDEKQMWDAIKRLVVRGAPAIGVAAAFGVYLGVRDVAESRVGTAHHSGGGGPWPSYDSFIQRLDEVCAYLATSRPTAVNLFWAIERIKRVASAPLAPGSPSTGSGQAAGGHTPAAHVQHLKQRILKECLRMIDEDIQACRAIGEHGLELLKSIRRNEQVKILTHCNAGALAAIRYGTALAPVYVGVEQGMAFHVYSDETRPLLQGSRLTSYEMTQAGIPVTVLCDNMAATLMSQGTLDAVIVGADRIAANGDTANKIGTMGVAILAKHFGVPFFVAAPLSTVDFSIESGKQIPIEQRDGREVSNGFGKQTAPEGAEVFNPAFDVTPSELISAIITEKGVVRAPYREGLRLVRG